MMRKKNKKIDWFMVFLYVFFGCMCICFVVPVMLVISASFTSEAVLTSSEGFSIFPREFTVDAYKSAMGNDAKIIRAYMVTISQSVLGTLLSSVVAGLVAYPLSRSNFRFKTPITMFVFFTMLFSAGMIPTYITYAKSYGLADSFWVYILPGMTGGAWNTMIYRTFFKGLPESLYESAHLDGANELVVFFKIVVPLSTPVFASIGFMMLVSHWNNYSTSMIYIRDPDLYTLQYLLQRMMSEAEYLKELADNSVAGTLNVGDAQLPAESLKYAMCIIAAGPMLVVFPFFQKYFSKGLTVGAVKG